MILWADSFDHYGVTGDESNLTDGAWAEVNVLCSISNGTTDPARTGPRSLVMVNNSLCRRVFGGAKSRVGVAGAYYMVALPLAARFCYLMEFRDSANLGQFYVNVTTTGAIAIYLGDNVFPALTPIAVSADAVLTANAFNHVECWATMSNSGAGSIEVRVNQVTVLNLTGITNTNPTSTEDTASQVQIEWGGTAAKVFVDDLICADDQGTYNNSFIGDRKVYTDFPVADTAEVDWDPLSGSTRYQMIDEQAPDGDGSYVSTLTNGNKFGVSWPALDSSVASVDAVIFIHKSRKTDAGDCSVQINLLSSGDASAGDDRPMTTAYTLWQDVHETDPHTSAPFTKAAVDAAVFEAERTL